MTWPIYFNHEAWADDFETTAGQSNIQFIKFDHVIEPSFFLLCRPQLRNENPKTHSGSGNWFATLDNEIHFSGHVFTKWVPPYMRLTGQPKSRSSEDFTRSGSLKMERPSWGQEHFVGPAAAIVSSLWNEERGNLDPKWSAFPDRGEDNDCANGLILWAVWAKTAWIFGEQLFCGEKFSRQFASHWRVIANSSHQSTPTKYWSHN